MCDRVADDVRTRGEPMPRIVLLSEGAEVTLDLDAVARRDPG